MKHNSDRCTAIHLRPRLRALFAAAVLLAVSAAAWGDGEASFFFETLDRRDGLESLSISSIAQDKTGYLWVGTQAGLHRYNGYEFHLFEYEPFSDNSISGNVVQTLFYDEAHDLLWIGTYQGLNRFDLSEYRFTTFNHDASVSDSLSNNVVVCILRDSSDRVWVGTLGGVNRMNAEGSAFRRYPTGTGEGQISSATIRDIHEDADGTIWVVSNGGVYRYREGSDDFELVVGRGLGNSVSDLGMVMTEGPDGLFYIGIWDGGIVVYDPGAERVVDTIELADLRIYSMLLDSFGDLWVGTWGGGLFVVDTETLSVEQLHSRRGVAGSLAGDIVYSLFEDESGMVWLGTHGNGMNKFNPLSRHFEYMTNDPADPESLSTGSVTAVLIDSRERTWIGTYNGGLNLMDEYGGPVTVFANDPDDAESLSNNIVRAIAQAPDGSIWVATNQYLNRYEEDGTFTRFRTRDLDGPAGLPDSIIMAIMPAAAELDGISSTRTEGADDENLFWLGTYSNGAVLWGPESGVIEQIATVDPLVYSIDRDASGRLWIATNSGLSLYDGSSVRHLVRDGTPGGLAGQTVRSQVLDGEGNLWAGTIEGGISVVSPGFEVIRHFSRSDGLASNTITGMVLASDGTVWATTNRGANQLSLEGGVLATLNQDQGLAYDEFSSGAWAYPDGRLILGNTRGITRFDPRYIGNGRRAVFPTVTGAVFGNSSILTASSSGEQGAVVLAWTENSILIEFAVLDFSVSRDIRYQYRLEGFDTDWIPAGNRHEAVYTNLPPDRYRFTVVLDPLVEDAAIPPRSTLEIVVEAPPYLRWWAYLLYAAAAVLILFGITQIRVSAALKGQVRTLESVKRELESANRKLNYLSYHDVLTGLGNRRLFTDVLHREWTRCRRNKEPLSLVLADIDFFKRYNDALGHPAGDRVLKLTADTLRTAVTRGTDLACRIGGEEFALILPATGHRGARMIAEKVRERILRQRIHHPDSEIGAYLSLSLGVGTLVPDSGEVQPLIDRTDEALYRAKALGRDRIESAKLGDADAETDTDTEAADSDADAAIEEDTAADPDAPDEE